MELYDPLRKKNVEATPEERVRQWFIGELKETFGVPLYMMMSEVGFEYGQKRYRADIVIYDRQGGVLAVVECKAPNVVIDQSVAEQALRYNMVLGARFIFLTNANLTYIYKLENGAFVHCTKVPSFEEMLCQR